MKNVAAMAGRWNVLALKNGPSLPALRPGGHPSRSIGSRRDDSAVDSRLLNLTEQPLMFKFRASILNDLDAESSGQSDGLLVDDPGLHPDHPEGGDVVKCLVHDWNCRLGPPKMPTTAICLYLFQLGMGPRAKLLPARIFRIDVVAAQRQKSTREMAWQDRISGNPALSKLLTLCRNLSEGSAVTVVSPLSLVMSMHRRKPASESSWSPC